MLPPLYDLDDVFTYLLTLGGQVQLPKVLERLTVIRCVEMKGPVPKTAN
jgi:hypothetical protein